MREVWPSVTDLDTLRSNPRSDLSAIHERLFLLSLLTQPDFGETTFFGQRFSGFFVPPKSSLYTFNLRSDDLSQLFLSQTSSSDDVERIIHVTEHTRLRFVCVCVCVCVWEHINFNRSMSH